MKPIQKKYLFLFSSIIILIVIVVFWNKLHHKKELIEDAFTLTDENERWEVYFNDSTFNVVVDSIITIYDVKTGRKLNSLYKPMGYPIMAMHPSGSHLAVLNEYELVLCKVNGNDTTSLPEDYSTVYEYGKDNVEFSKDGKYLIVTDNADVQICIYSWPTLKYLDTGICGFYRDNFWREEKDGKLVYKYETMGCKNYTYRMIFPVSAQKLKFSEPVCIDSCFIIE